MRVLPLGVVVAISILLGAGVASAEKVRTNQTTKLLARPGEQAKTLLTVKSGQNMTLLSQDGRWLKVRVSGRTGYVPRSKVDMADDSGIARNTRRRPFVDGRGKKRGFGGESAPDDRVGADATGETSSDDGDSGDDEEDTKPKKAPAKAAPAKASTSKGKPKEDEEGDEEGDEEDDEDETPAPKKAPPPKAAPKAPPPKAAAKATDEDDEEDSDEEDDDEKPAAKAAAKPAEKPAPKAAAKPAAKKESADDEDEGDEEGDSDDEDKPAAKKGASSSDDEEADGPVKKKAASDDREVAHVRKKVATYEKPDAESEESFVARPTDMLFPKEEKNGWTHVENAEGDDGWLESDQLEAGGGAASGKMAIDVGARVGLTIIQQGMRTAGSNVLEVPDNYNIGTSSATLSLGAGILIPRGKSMLLGGEFTYDYAKALGGGVAFDPDGPDGPMPVARIGITLHNVNVRGIAGIDFKKKNGMALLGHLGYRYQGFLVTDVTDFTKNPARLPSEVVKGPTLGAAFVIPRITDKIGIKFSLDAMLFGASVNQTVGLEDGSSPSVKAIVVGTGFTYRLKSIELAAAYDLNYMGIDFGAPVMTSMRNHMGTNVTRTDIFHMVTFGIAKPF